MFHASSEELQYLKKVISLIDEYLKGINEKIEEYGISIISDKKNLWENIYELDPVEIMQAQEEIEDQVHHGHRYVKEKAKYDRMRKSPYFARIDFKEEETGEVIHAYIGLGALIKTPEYDFLIYDWRAPISSMFYEFELGKAHYVAPESVVEGEIILKRHYKVEGDKIINYADSGTNINDDVLMEVLSQSSDQKMHNIVATIQREQNSIIRDVSSKVLIIQGVAGSGKTSIALHRAAYLLYKYKGTLSSNEILIVSPNKIFSEYISGVLPELDEENILQCEVDQIADRVIPNDYNFEKSWEQAERLIDGNDMAYAVRAKYKSSREFFDLLKSYVDERIDAAFKPSTITIGKKVVSTEYLETKYKNYGRYTPAERIKMITEDLIIISEGEGVRANKRKMNDMVQKMYTYTSAVDVYSDFFKHISKPEYFVHKGKAFEYADLFPIAYIEARFNSKKSQIPIKHLIIDEMQDYSPVCFELINLVYDCNKTILGDVAQSISGITNSISDIQQCFDDVQVVEINKSYRSTYEIIDFSKHIKPELKDIVPMVRHGEEVKCIKYDDIASHINDAIKYAKKNKLKSIGIICKNKMAAAELYEKVKGKVKDISLIEDGRNTKAVISTVQLSKGLEFDYVIVVDADTKNYHSEADRSLLYVACTRAMHKLELIYQDQFTDLLDINEKPEDTVA